MSDKYETPEQFFNEALEQFLNEYTVEVKQETK